MQQIAANDEHPATLYNSCDIIVKEEEIGSEVSGQ
jgi:hypothetical protein